jgi:hypothetical protein
MDPKRVTKKYGTVLVPGIRILNTSSTSSRYMNNLGLDQCCGSGSAWIRIKLRERIVRIKVMRKLRIRNTGLD